MFLVICKHNDTFRQWEALLGSRQIAPHQRASLEEGLALSEQTRFSLIVVDALAFPDALTTPALHQLCKRSRTLLVNANLPPDQELQALSLGIAGCCAHELSTTELEKIVDIILKGGIWVSRTALPDLFRKLGAAPSAHTAEQKISHDPLLSQLTPKEREVARLVSAGANNKSIAQHLRVSDVTIKTHLSAIFRKLGVSSRTQMAVLLSEHFHSAPPPAH